MPSSVYRAVVLGAPGSGKTSLVRRFVDNKFEEAYEPTIEDKHTKKATFEGIPIVLEILDTSGKELFANQHDPYFAHSDAFIVCYAVDDRKSYEYAVKVFTQIALHRGTHSIPRVLVGTKLDLPNRTVSLESGNMLSAQLQCSFAEISAMHDINVTEVFEEVVSQIRFIRGMQKKAREAARGSSIFCCLLG